MSVIYAGIIIRGSNDSYKRAPAKAKAINELEPPKIVTQVRLLLGLLNGFNNFLPDLTQLRPSIPSLLRKDSAFLWSEECDKEFTEIKNGIKTIRSRMADTNMG